MKKLLLIVLLVCIKQVNAQIITTVAGNGIAGYSGDGGQATTAQLSQPAGLITDALGNLYFADTDNNCIRKVSNTGIISTIAGNGTSGFSGDGGYATLAELNTPWGVSIDAIGNIYISDTYNYRIRKINTIGIISTIAGTGITGYSGDGGQATSASFSKIYGNIINDGLGNLYFADTDNNCIRKVNTSGIINTIAGSGTPPYNAGFSGDGSQATIAELSYPLGIAFDGFSNLYIADGNNNRIRKVNTLGIISTIVGNGILGYSGDGGQATAAELYNPVGVVFDGYNNLYINDGGNHRMRKVNTSGIINTAVGDGTAGFSGNGGQANLAEIYYPRGLTIASSNNMFIADGNNYRIRKVTNVENAGMEQIKEDNVQLFIYPNPNNGSFVVEPQNTLYNAHYTVYDVNGKAVLNQTINGKTTIDTGTLNEGVYNISLQSNEGVVNKKLIIVR